MEDKESEQLNRDKEECRALFQLESAVSCDFKTRNPHLNMDSSCHRDVGLEAAVLQKEE